VQLRPFSCYFIPQTFLYLVACHILVHLSNIEVIEIKYE
jgi:hypothetical protein